MIPNGWRSRLLQACTAVLLAAFLAGCGGALGRPRDVILITLDTTRADRLGCYGYTKAETPNLDALAQEATLFEHAVSAASVTLVSHATMFTGLYPYRHGVRYNGMFTLADAHYTLAERLRERGFRTAAIVSSFPVNHRFGLNQGFELYDDRFSEDEVGRALQNAERRARESVDLALAWWRERAGEPRFLWLHLFDPHWNYDPPFPYSSRFRERPYDGEIAYMDRELGRFFETLRERGDWDPALLIVAGDHGEGLYEHNERWHSYLIYETTVHVPLIVKAPGQRSGQRIAGPVSLADLAPTILEFVGISPEDEGFDGVSLVQALRTGKVPERSLYFEAMGGNLNYGWAPYQGLRVGAWKYAEGARPELYDLGSDPGELNDLSDQESERRASLARALSRFRQAAEQAGNASPTVVLDEEILEQLTSLGYVGSTEVSQLKGGRGAHPPDMIDLEPELLRAQSLVSTDDWAAAVEALDFLLRRDPTNRFALAFRTQAHMRAGELSEALAVAETLHRLYPDSAHAADLHGEVLAALRRYDEAADLYARALEQHPHHTLLRYHRVLVLVDGRRFEEADAEMDRLEEHMPEHRTTYAARALVEAARGNVDASLAALEKAVDAGLGSLDAMDQSPWFEAVRRDPRYAAVKQRASEAAAGT